MSSSTCEGRRRWLCAEQGCSCSTSTILAAHGALGHQHVCVLSPWVLRGCRAQPPLEPCHPQGDLSKKGRGE